MNDQKKPDPPGSPGSGIDETGHIKEVSQLLGEKEENRTSFYLPL